jgi:predicted acyl esterase
VMGPVTLTLFAATSAVDTDFTGKLVDVHPDGFARNLTDGILRARYRESRVQGTLLKPGGHCQLICIDARPGRARGGFLSSFLQAAKAGVVISCQM